MNATDLSLLEAWVRLRDAEAFHELVRRHANMVFRTARRMLGDSTEAEDVTQECFEQLLRAERPPNAFLAPWLHRVAVNRCLSRMRKQETRGVKTPASPAALNNVARIERNDLYSAVDLAMESLPDDLRMVLVAHFLEQRTHEEIAVSLGLERSSVTKRIQKGIETLRGVLHERGVLLGLTGLAGIFEADAARALPASLVKCLGKIALSGHAAPATSAAGAVTAWAWAGAATLLFTVVVGIGLLVSDSSTFENTATQEAARQAAVEQRGTGQLPAPETASVPVAIVKPASGASMQSTNATPAAPGTANVIAINAAAVSRQPTLKFAGLQQGSSPAVTGTGQIRGRVVNAASGEPVAEVPIVATDPARGNFPGGPALQATSDGDGRFELRDIPVGNWRIAPLLMWTYPGSNITPEIVLLDKTNSRYFETPRSQSEVHVTMNAGQVLEDVVLRLDFGAPLSGTVSDSSGKFVVDAVVEGRVVGTGESIQARTDDSGKFTLRLPAGGAVTLVARKDPYTGAAYEISMLTGSGMVGLELLIERPPLGSVSGIVVDSLDKPAEGVVVSLQAIDPQYQFDRPGSLHSSKPDGTFLIDDVPRGKYEIAVGKRRGLSLTTGPANPPVRFEVAGAEQVKDIVVTYDTSPRDDMPTRPALEDEIWGTVYNSEGMPAEYPQVHCVSNIDETHSQLLTGDSKGRFLFSGLEPGSYWVAAFGGPISPDPADPLIVEAGTSDVEVRLPSLVRVKVHGKVVDAQTGKPIPEFWAGSSKGPRNRITPGMFHTEERFLAENGTFEITSQQSDIGTCVVAIRATDYESAFKNIVVAEMTDEVLTFSLAKPAVPQLARVYGRVLDAQGKPVDKAQVYLGMQQPASAPLRTCVAETLPTGDFELSDLPPGMLVLSARHPDFGEGSAYVTEDMSITLRPGARLTALVMNDAGEPVAGERVRISYAADALVDFVDGGQTNASGRIEKSSLPPGAAMLTAEVAPGHSVMADVALQPGALTELTLETAPATAALKGRVQYDGQPQASTQVELFCRTARGTEYLETSTNREGEYLFPAIPAGELRVEVLNHEAEPTRFDVDFLSISEGAQIEHDVDFAAGVAVSGKVSGFKPGQWVWVSLRTEIPRDGLDINDVMSGVHPTLVRHAKVEEDGSFTVGNVRPGTYIVHAALMPQMRVYRLLAQCSQPVEVREDGAAEVRLRFAAP